MHGMQEQIVGGGGVREFSLILCLNFVLAYERDQSVLRKGKN